MNMTLDGQKVVLILENSNHKLKVKESSDKNYVLEGVFCQFGVENNNKRIYEEREYLPHLDYLTEKIKLGNLTGQLDHPQDFEVRLSEASHLIEGLEYDKDNRQVVGKVRLLSTSKGRDARALIDDGVQLSISSRAAGVVESDKSVKIKRIFTYDLVADPGFANAQLTRLNESLGFHNNDSVKIYDMSSKYASVEDAIGGFDSQDKNQPPKMDQTRYVSEEVLNDYSKEIRKEFERFSKRLDEMKTEETPNLNSDSFIGEFERMSKYVNYLAEKLDQVIDYSNYLAENTENIRNYSNYITESLNDSIDYSEHIAEHVHKTQTYTNYLAENLDRGIQYTEHVGEEVESQAKKINESIKYSNYIAEKLDTGLQYSDYIAENIDKTQKYADYLGENLDSSIKHSDYLSEHLDNTIRYTEYIAENVSTKKNIGKPVNESLNENALYNSNGEVKPIGDRIDSILESIRKQKVESVAKKNNYQFMSILSEAKQNDFLALDETEKQKVVKSLNEGVWFGESDVIRIWNNALSNVNSNYPKWIQEMPVEYSPIWESLTTDEKNRIVAQSKMYRLDTPYQIRNFWSTRGLESAKVRTSSLNESDSNVGGGFTNSDLGYDNDFVTNIASQLASRFNR